MVSSLRSAFCIAGLNEVGLEKRRMLPFSHFEGFQRFKVPKSADFLGLRSEFKGPEVVLSEKRSSDEHKPANFTIHAQASHCVSKALRWWEKSLKPNMMEIKSAQELVDSLLNAGDKLVIIDFYSPGCGGCKALHPKICQLAEINPNVQFLQLNYEEHKSMCHSLHIHVLPFFRFYRGAQGRLCSFSCTNATIKKFKDALAKHGTGRCSLGPAKGLEESELLMLASNRELCFNFPSRTASASEETEKFLLAEAKNSSSPSLAINQIEEVEERIAAFAL